MPLRTTRATRSTRSSWTPCKFPYRQCSIRKSKRFLFRVQKALSALLEAQASLVAKVQLAPLAPRATTELLAEKALLEMPARVPSLVKREIVERLVPMGTLVLQELMGTPVLLANVALLVQLAHPVLLALQVREIARMLCQKGNASSF